MITMNFSIQSQFSKKFCLKIFVVLLLGLIFCAPKKTEARLGGPLGLGFVAGLPSGISGKYWLNDHNAIDGVIGYNAWDKWLLLNADYVFHEYELIRVPQGQLPLYYGIGAWAAIANHAAIGIHGVVGLDYLFPGAPIDAFIELAPGTSILPGTEFNMGAGVGARFFF